MYKLFFFFIPLIDSTAPRVTDMTQKSRYFKCWKGYCFCVNTVTADCSVEVVKTHKYGSIYALYSRTLQHQGEETRALN